MSPLSHVLVSIAISSAVHSAAPLPQTVPQDPEPARPVLSLGDFDGDLWLDAYAIYEGGEGRLWRNLGDGTFEDATERAGLAGIAGALGTAWVDYDDDGRLDLYVIASRTERRLLRNLDGGAFEDATASAGLAGVADEIAARWVDFNDDGHEDLFIRTASGDLLFHNNGRGQLEPIDLGAVERALALAPFAASDLDVERSGEVGAPSRRPFAPLPPLGAPSGSSPRASSSISLGPSASSGVLGPNPFSPAQPLNFCAPGVLDDAGGPCITASSVPVLGKLYPLSNDLFVDAASGYVGVGTNAPEEELHVLGGNTAVLIDGTDPYVQFRHAGSTIARLQGANSALILSADSGQPIHFDVGGGLRVAVAPAAGGARVGIGTSIPTERLHIESFYDPRVLVDSLDGTSTGLLLRQGGAQRASLIANIGNTYLDSGPGSAMHVRAEGTAGLVVVPGGSVGIGTMTPAATLDVTAPSNAALRVASDTGDAYLWLGGPTGVGFIRPTWDSAGDLSIYSITSAGLGGQLYVGGPSNDIRGTGFGSVEIAAFGTPSLTGDVFLSTQGQVRMMVDQDGRVGIGTMSPASTLSVDGNGAFSTSLSVGTTLGIGTSAPTAPLDVRGGNAWTTWSKAVELDDGSALKWRGSGAGWRHGIVQGANGLEIIRAQVDDGSASHQKSIVVSNDGWVGIGTTGTPTAKLQVSDGNVGNFGASTGIALSGAGDQSIAVNTISSGSAGLFLHNAGANAWRVSADRASDDFVIANDSAGVPWAGPAFVTVKDNGDVGIGTTTPLAKLDVDGTTRTQCVTITGGCDIVEGFETGDVELEPGTVLVIDPLREGELRASAEAYDKKVAGIVSGAGGVRPGLALAQEGALDGETKVAMAGRVYVKCSAENGAIEPGDRLTTASLAGHAMKATDHELCDGAVLGKAMSSLAEGTGLVLVLVNLQ